jgi:hypothetical protein
LRPDARRAQRAVAIVVALALVAGVAGLGVAGIGRAAVDRNARRVVTTVFIAVAARGDHRTENCDPSCPCAHDSLPVAGSYYE